LLVVLAGQHGHTVMVTYPYAYMTYIVSPLASWAGHIVAAARLQLVFIPPPHRAETLSDAFV